MVMVAEVRVVAVMVVTVVVAVSSVVTCRKNEE